MNRVGGMRGLRWMPLALAVAMSTAAIADPIDVENILDSAYGKPAADGCRKASYEGSDYCMKVDRVDRLDTDTGPRAYALLTGDVVDGGAHVQPGLVGAWVIDARGGKTSVIASVKAMPIGAYGNAPSKWTLLKLSKSDYWGWYNTTGDVHQGYAGGLHVILAPFGKTVRNLAGFVGSYSDEGACAEPACEKRSSNLESTLVVDDHDPKPEVYPLAVTVTGRSDGKALAPKTWTVPFDTRGWKYVPPKTWPLAKREF